MTALRWLLRRFARKARLVCDVGYRFPLTGWRPNDEHIHRLLDKERGRYPQYKHWVEYKL